MSNRYLLDTNVLFWMLVRDTESIPKSVVNVLEYLENEVLISTVSIWEIAIKRSIGKLTLAGNWFKEIKKLGFADIPLTAQHAQLVETLPFHHRDPFDRALVAQALFENATFVTPDRMISKYSVETLWE